MELSIVKETYGICLWAVMREGMCLASVPPALRTYEMCEAACEADPNAMQFVPPDLREGVERFLEKLKR